MEPNESARNAATRSHVPHCRLFQQCMTGEGERTERGRRGDGEGTERGGRGEGEGRERGGGGEGEGIP